MSLNRRQWNQGNSDHNPFTPLRMKSAHQVRIDLPARQVFERACLAGQPAWLPAGSARLSCSEYGPDGTDALWSEGETGRVLFEQPQLETFWATTRLDPASRRYQAVLINPELAMGTLDVEMEEHSDGTLVRFDLSYTVLSEAGSVLFDEGFDTRLAQALEGFGTTMRRSVTSERATPVVPASHQVRRQAAEHEVIISGDIDECFALACPVAELRWIDDWSFDLIYSESGRNETGCVFLEPSSGLSMLRVPGANTYWYTTLYDSEKHIFSAIWVTRDLTVARWEARMTDLGDGQTRFILSLISSGMGEEGSRILGEPGMEERMERGLRFIATSMKHYVETGSLYRLAGQMKVKIAASLAGACLGRHFRRLRAR